MKRSRSGTKSRPKRSRRLGLELVIAVLAVLAFIASFVFGLDRNSDQRPAPSPEVAPAPAAVPDSRVRIEVLNGSGKPGLARLATEKLRSAGYDVVHFGNAGSATANSIVIDRVSRREIADRVARDLQIARVETRVDSSRYLEVTVLLGKDWPAARPRQR